MVKIGVLGVSMLNNLGFRESEIDRLLLGSVFYLFIIRLRAERPCNFLIVFLHNNLKVLELLSPFITLSVKYSSLIKTLSQIRGGLVKIKPTKRRDSNWHGTEDLDVMILCNIQSTSCRNHILMAYNNIFT
jgi:hypothetical protein